MKKKSSNLSLKQRILNKKREGMVEKSTGADLILDIVVYAILVVCSFVFLIPLWHVLMSSFSVGNELFAKSGIVWWPITPEGQGWNFGGYELMFSYSGVMVGYGNTLLYVVASTLLGLVLNVMGGYVMSRQSRLQPFFIIYVLITMMFSGGMIPTYMVVKTLGLVESRLAIILLSCTNALYMVLTMNAFRGVNASTIEAAEIDGAGHFTIMFKVMLPQAMSMISVVLLFTIVGIWNSWFEAKIYTPFNTEAWPLQLWINKISADNADFLLQTKPDWNKYVLTYSVIVAATAPILIVATVFQKWIEKGVIMGGVKE